MFLSNSHSWECAVQLVAFASLAHLCLCVYIIVHLVCLQCAPCTHTSVLFPFFWVDRWNDEGSDLAKRKGNRANESEQENNMPYTKINKSSNAFKMINYDIERENRWNFVFREPKQKRWKKRHIFSLLRFVYFFFFYCFVCRSDTKDNGHLRYEPKI